MAFNPNFAMGLAVPKNGETIVYIARGVSLREASMGYLGIEPLHRLLQKGPTFLNLGCTSITSGGIFRYVRNTPAYY